MEWCGSRSLCLGILKWRYQTRDEGQVPISINCWPSVSAGESFVSIEYEAGQRAPRRAVPTSPPIFSSLQLD